MSSSHNKSGTNTGGDAMSQQQKQNLNPLASSSTDSDIVREGTDTDNLNAASSSGNQQDWNSEQQQGTDFPSKT